MGTRKGRVESDVTHKLRSYLQLTLCGTQEADKHVSVVATTNYPMCFGDALDRRFNYIEVPELDNPRDRLKVLKRNCVGYTFGYNLSPNDWERLSLRLSGYNGSDVVKLVTLVREERIGAFDNCRNFYFDPKTDTWNACYGDLLEEMKKNGGTRRFEGQLCELENLTRKEIRSRPIIYADFMRCIKRVQANPYNDMREDHKLYKAKKGCVYISKRCGT